MTEAPIGGTEQLRAPKSPKAPHAYDHLAELTAVLILLSSCKATEVRATLGLARDTSEPTTPTAMPAETMEPTPGLATFAPTSAPTYSSVEARNAFEAAVTTNGNCRLPCLLALDPSEITPGQLPGPFLRFGDKYIIEGFTSTARNEAGSSTLLATFREGDLRVIVEFGSYFGAGETPHLFLEAGGSRRVGQGDNIGYRTTIADPTFQRLLAPFLIRRILSQYGVPGEVLLAPFPPDAQLPASQWVLFSIALLYPEQAFAVEYVGPRVVSGDYISWCQGRQSDEIYLWSWAPTSDPDLSALLNPPGRGLSDNLLHYYKPLSEATTLTPQRFYDTFSRLEGNACLQTPSYLWPPHE